MIQANIRTVQKNSAYEQHRHLRQPRVRKPALLGLPGRDALKIRKMLDFVFFPRSSCTDPERGTKFCKWDLTCDLPEGISRQIEGVVDSQLDISCRDRLRALLTLPSQVIIHRCSLREALLRCKQRGSQIASSRWYGCGWLWRLDDSIVSNKVTAQGHQGVSSIDFPT